MISNYSLPKQKYTHKKHINVIRKRRTFWPNQIWRWPRPILEENPNCEAITTFEPGMEPITRFIFLQPMIFNMCSEEIFGKIKSSLRKYYSICIIYQIQTNYSLILVQQVLEVAQNSFERYRLFKRQVYTSIYARVIFQLILHLCREGNWVDKN